MRRSTSISYAAVAILAILASPGRAADLPSRKAAPLPPPEPFAWTGVYIGANVGGSFGTSEGSGVSGGGQVGYNYQLAPLFVLGAEADIQGTTLGLRHSSIDYFGTVRGRVGVTPLDPHLLVYGTGGLAYAQVRYGINDLNDNRTGWTAGGGVEWAILPNWSVKAEYLYADISTEDLVYNPILNLNLRPTKYHTVRAGANYHFTLFPPAPILAAR